MLFLVIPWRKARRFEQFTNTYVVTDNFIHRKSDFFSLAKNERIVITYVFTSEIRKINEHATEILRWLEQLTFWTGVRRATNCATRPIDYLRNSLTIYQCLSENNKNINLVERKSTVLNISLKKYQHRFYSFVTRDSQQIKKKKFDKGRFPCRELNPGQRGEYARYYSH